MVISTLFFILFFGLFAALPMILFLIWLRASLARLRFDQLIAIGWSYILPITMGYLLLLPCCLLTFDLIAGLSGYLRP
jgi:NADH:ubiquinone oxidoreductase subunit H